MAGDSRKSYPVATPFKTAEGDGQEARLRLWTRILAAGTAALVLALIISLFLVGRELLRVRGSLEQHVQANNNDRPELTASREERAAPEVEVTKKLPTPPAALETAKVAPPAQPQAVVPKTLKDSKPAKDKPVETPRPAETADERFVEVLGGLTAAHLYQSYLNIGLLADAAEDEVYPLEDAKKQLDKVTTWMDAVDRQLTKLAEATLKPDDRESLDETRECTALLRTEAKQLRTYWDSGAKEDAAKFHKAREEAWAAIKDLLDIKEDPASDSMPMPTAPVVPPKKTP